MSVIKYTLSKEVLLFTEDFREFRIMHGEIFEVVEGPGFVVTTKVVVRRDLSFVCQQLQLAKEHNHAE